MDEKKEKQQPFTQENIHEIVEVVLEKKVKELKDKKMERLQQIVGNLNIQMQTPFT